MNIKKTRNDAELIIAVSGSLDSTTAPTLEKEVDNSLNGVASLIFDFKDLDYISSAGLRILIRCHKIMTKEGSMVVRNANEEIMDIFEVTGFVDVLNIEK